MALLPHNLQKEYKISPQTTHVFPCFIPVSTLLRCLFKRDRSPHIRALFPRVSFFKSPTVTKLSIITSTLSLSFLGRPAPLILLAALCLRLCCVDGLILSSIGYFRALGLYRIIEFSYFSWNRQKSIGSSNLQLILIFPSATSKYIAYATTTFIAFSCSIGECQYFHDL